MEENEEKKDPITPLIGEYGRWQLKFTALLCFMNIIVGWNIFSGTFHNYELENKCENISETKQSNVSYANQTTDFTNQSHPECQKLYLTGLAETMFYVGNSLAIFSGWISDTYGRKKTLICLLSLGTLTAITNSLVYTIELYIFFRAILGFVTSAISNTSFLLALELVDGKWRSIVEICAFMPNSVAYVSMALISWILKEWWIIQLTIGVLGSVFLPLSFLVPESPRWLFATGRRKDLLELVQKAAKVNKIELPAKLDVDLEENQTEPDVSVSILDLVKTPAIRKMSIIVFCVWLFHYFTSYGFLLNVGHIGGDIHLNLLIYGLIDVPAYVIVLVAVLKGGKKKPLTISLFTVSLLCIITIIISAITDWPTVVLAHIGKFFTNIANLTIAAVTAELYPTSIRNIGLAGANVFAGIAMIFTPHLWKLGVVATWLPWAVLSVTSMVAGFCVVTLPNTEGKTLKNTVKEFEESITYK